MAQDKVYTSAYQRLMAMPEIFNAISFARLNNVTPKEASVYLSRMKTKKMVDSFDGRAKVYFNLVKNQQAKSDHIIDGLKMIYPCAILRGESVLHNAGWTTQIPQRINIAVLESRSYINISEFVLSPKKQDWYDKVRSHWLMPNNKEKIATFGLPALPPALALADLYHSKSDWQPDPDDLDIDEQDWEAIKKAFDFFKLDIPEKYREFI